MLHHVAHQKAIMTAVNSICHPISGDCGLFPTLHQNLHLSKAHDDILIQDGAANCMLLTAMALVAQLGPNNLDHNARRMHQHRSFCLYFLAAGIIFLCEEAEGNLY
jgi:hypothetical protein